MKNSDKPNVTAHCRTIALFVGFFLQSVQSKLLLLPLRLLALCECFDEDNERACGRERERAMPSKNHQFTFTTIMSDTWMHECKFLRRHHNRHTLLTMAIVYPSLNYVFIFLAIDRKCGLVSWYYCIVFIETVWKLHTNWNKTIDFFSENHMWNGMENMHEKGFMP